MIEPCPNCGKAPDFRMDTYWRCLCNNNGSGVCIYGEDSDPDGKKWNAMVQRMRGVTPESRPAVAYPERMRRARKQIAELRAAIADRDERLNSALLQIAELREQNIELNGEVRATAELRAAIADAWGKFQKESQKLVTPEPGMTWAELNAVAKVGDRAVCGKFRDNGYLVKCAHTTGWIDSWEPTPKYHRYCACGWSDQADWRIIGRADA